MLWCIGIGVWIWVTPIRYHGVEATTGGATAPAREYDVYRSFADVSLLGPVPLIVPTLLALGATYAAWRRRTILLVVFTLALLLFVFVAGFSVGPAYLPSGGLLVAASAVAVARAGLLRAGSRRSEVA